MTMKRALPEGDDDSDIQHPARKHHNESLGTDFVDPADGDIHISLRKGDHALTASKAKLAQASAYCAKLFDDESGSEFMIDLEPDSNDLWMIVPAQESLNEQRDDDWIETRRQKCNIIIKLLCGLPSPFAGVRIRDPEHILQYAQIMDSYDALSEGISDKLVAMICTAENCGLERLPKEPATYLDFATLVKNERIYVDALRHCVSRWTPDTSEERDSCLEELMEKHKTALNIKVRGAIEAMIKRIPAQSSLADFIARSSIHSWMRIHTLDHNSDASSAYAPLRWLMNDVRGRTLLDSQSQGYIMDSIIDIENGLTGGSNLSNYLDDDVREELVDDISSLRTAKEVRFGSHDIETVLWCWVNNAKESLKPLFELDKNYGYFICIDFDDSYPWKATALDAAEERKESTKASWFVAEG